MADLWSIRFPAALGDVAWTTAMSWQVVLLGVLILLSAFFSGSEIALFRMSKTRRRHIVAEGVKGAPLVDAMMRHPNRVLITILVGNNLVNIAAAALATALALQIFGSAGIGIATGIMTLLVLIVGEITPKAYASRHPQGVSLRVTPVLRFLMVMLFPVVWALEKMTDLVFRIFGARRSEERTFMSADEIRTLVDIGTEEGVLEEEEQEMIHGVISFGDLMAKEVMVPRPDMVCLASDASVRDAVRVAVESGYSRLPIYTGSKDNVVGILYAKDLLAQLAEGKADAPVTTLARECLFIPETNTLDDVLAELQDKRVHMAIVVDEHGGTSGIVTMEDLLEEIVGEIFDEYDLRREAIRVLDERVAVVDARVHVDDVNETIGTEIPEDEVFETVGGMVHHSLGRLAQEGETFEVYGMRVRVEKVVNRRVLRVRIERKPDGQAPTHHED